MEISSNGPLASPNSITFVAKTPRDRDLLSMVLERIMKTSPSTVAALAGLTPAVLVSPDQGVLVALPPEKLRTYQGLEAIANQPPHPDRGPTDRQTRAAHLLDRLTQPYRLTEDLPQIVIQ